MDLPSAFLFDLNGTMIDDMVFHLDIWYDILVNDCGAQLSREEVKHQMYGKNHELLERVFGKDKFTAEELESISFDKEVRYQKRYRPHLNLLPGLFSFLQQAGDNKIKMAIGSAAIPFNIDFVIDNLKIRHYFEAIVSSYDVTRSKPDPQTFLKAAEILNVPPSRCIVFEDVPKGVEAAQQAGMKAVVLTTTHPKEDFRHFDNVLMFKENYVGINPLALLSSTFTPQ